MLLSDSIDAALAAAAKQSARPFRIDLADAEIGTLRDGGALMEQVGPKTVSPGAYAGVNVFPTQKQSQVLAQPEGVFKALNFPITG